MSASKRFVGFVALLLALALPVVAQTASFPAYAETEYEQSIITIPIYSPEGGENPVEILKLTAFMRLERELPVRNGLGHRQIEFTIADWELYGYSKYLDTDITFRLSDVPVQPKSLVISLTEKNDYPAMIIYNAIYDIYLGQKRVSANRPGVAFAKNVFESPPRNVSVAFTKPFNLPRGFDKDGLRKVGTNTRTTCPPDVFYCCDPMYEICMGNGTCEDMYPIPQAEFDAGVAIAKAIRAGEMTLKGR